MAAERAKSRFLAQMSHEIRTPINAVLGMNEMVLREAEDENIKNILSVAVIAPFFLFGFDVIPQVAEEINVLLRKVGKLMLLSIIMAVLFYALVVFAVGYIMGPSDIERSMNSSGLVTADAMAKAFSSEAMAKVLIIGGLYSSLSYQSQQQYAEKVVQG